jgi:hypothetical protein
MAVIAPKKNTVGTANACTASQRTVKIGSVYDFLAVMVFSMNFKREILTQKTFFPKLIILDVKEKVIF